MADERIEDITGGELTAPAPDDLLVILDASDTTDDPQGTAKRIKYASLGDGLLVQTVASGGDVTPTNQSTYTDFSATRSKFYWVDVPYCNTLDTTDGNCVVNLPGAPAAGDRIGVGVQVQATAAGATFTQAPGFCVELNPGAVKINGATYTEKTVTGGEKWSLWLPGECLILEYINATIGWAVVYDGRIAHNCHLKNTSTQSPSAGTWTLAQFSAAISDNAGLGNVTNETIEIKRAGVAALVDFGAGQGTIDDGSWEIVAINRNNASVNLSQIVSNWRRTGGQSNTNILRAVGVIPAAENNAADVLRGGLFTTDASTWGDATGKASQELRFCFVEIL